MAFAAVLEPIVEESSPCARCRRGRGSAHAPGAGRRGSRSSGLPRRSEASEAVFLAAGSRHRAGACGASRSMRSSARGDNPPCCCSWITPRRCVCAGSLCSSSGLVRPNASRYFSASSPTVSAVQRCDFHRLALAKAECSAALSEGVSIRHVTISLRQRAVAAGCAHGGVVCRTRQSTLLSFSTEIAMFGLGGPVGGLGDPRRSNTSLTMPTARRSTTSARAACGVVFDARESDGGAVVVCFVRIHVALRWLWRRNAGAGPRFVTGNGKKSEPTCGSGPRPSLAPWSLSIPCAAHMCARPPAYPAAGKRAGGTTGRESECQTLPMCMSN